MKIIVTIKPSNFVFTSKRERIAAMKEMLERVMHRTSSYYYTVAKGEAEGYENKDGLLSTTKLAKAIESGELQLALVRVGKKA